MILRKGISLLLFLAVYCVASAQEIPLKYTFGEKYNDRYKYSNLLTIGDDEKGGSLLVRAYYTGMVLRPKGYFIENYDKDLNLVSEYNYKLKNANFVEGYVRNGQIYLLFLDYNYDTEAYDYVVHRSPINSNETPMSSP